MAQVLVIAEERHIGRLIEVNLSKAGYSCVYLWTVHEGILWLQVEEAPELVILDHPESQVIRDYLAADAKFSGTRALALSEFKL